MNKRVAIRNLLVVFLILFGAFQEARAQKITISEEVVLRNDYAYTILGWVGEDLLLFRDKGHEFFVQAFDADLHLKWEREIYLGESRADIIGVIAQTDRFHLIFGMRDRGDYKLFHQAFNHDVTLIDTATITVFPNVFMPPRVLMKESDDRSKVLLYEEENKSLRVISYDLQQSKVLWNKAINTDGTAREDEFRSILVNNDGDFYLTLRPDRNQYKNQYLHIFSSSPVSIPAIHDTIRLADLELLDVFPAYDHVTGDLTISGMYGDRNTSRAKGFYFIRYQHGQTRQVSYLPFDESLLAEVSGRDASVARGLSDFSVQNVALRQDGGAVIIAELIKEFSRRSSIPMQMDNGALARDGWVDYYFEDLILFAVYPDGSEHWKEVLRKRQYSQDDGAMYSSFMLFKTPERLRFLFNDEIKQENTVGGYEVTGIGYTERKTVFNTDYQKLKLRFRDGVQLSNHECIIPSERNNRLNLVRIRFDEG